MVTESEDLLPRWPKKRNADLVSTMDARPAFQSPWDRDQSLERLEVFNQVGALFSVDAERVAHIATRRAVDDVFERFRRAVMEERRRARNASQRRRVDRSHAEHAVDLAVGV